MKTIDLLCIVPAYNEEALLPQSIPALMEYLATLSGEGSYLVVVADNGSTDGTAAVVRALERDHPSLVYEHVNMPGRGRAIRSIFNRYQAKKYVFIDADLPCELTDIGRLVQALDGGVDLAISSRQGARPLGRKLMTFSLRVVNRLVFGLRFSDTQCSVKALGGRAAAVLRENCREDGWYLDTELVVQAARNRLQTVEIPITWLEKRYPGRRSKVRPVRDIIRGVTAVTAIRRRSQAGEA